MILQRIHLSSSVRLQASASPSATAFTSASAAPLSVGPLAIPVVFMLGLRFTANEAEIVFSLLLPLRCLLLRDGARVAAILVRIFAALSASSLATAPVAAASVG